MKVRLNRALPASQHQGFTLIELLVVIAIIAILAAILFPVFAQAREKARAIACLSNGKQIGLGILQYEQDYDELNPAGLNGYGGGAGWAGQVYPYVKSTKVFQCPDDSSVNAGTGAASSLGLNYNMSTISPACVAANYNGCCNMPGQGIALAQLHAPASTVMLFETSNNSPWYNVSTEAIPGASGSTIGSCGGSPSGNGIWSPSGWNGPSSWQTATVSDGALKYATGILNGDTTNLGDFFPASGRHQGGANYVMADGHSKFLRGSQVSPGQNPSSETSNQVNDNTAAGTSGYFADGKTHPAATFSIL